MQKTMFYMIILSSAGGASTHLKASYLFIIWSILQQKPLVESSLWVEEPDCPSRSLIKKLKYRNWPRYSRICLEGVFRLLWHSQLEIVPINQIICWEDEVRWLTEQIVKLIHLLKPVSYLNCACGKPQSSSARQGVYDRSVLVIHTGTALALSFIIT